MKASTAARRDQIVEALEQLAQYGVPAVGAAHLFDVGSGAFVEYFAGEILDELVCRGGATCKFLEGPYGSGKTHLLQLLHASALSKGMAIVRTDLSQAVSLEDWRLIAQHLLRTIEVETSSGVVRSLPKILETLAREKRLVVSALHPTSLPHQGFANAIAMMATSRPSQASEYELLSRFLQGDSVRVSSLRAAGLTGIKHPLSVRNAELVVRTVVAALYRLGVPGTLLLFDEAEKTFAFRGSHPPKRILTGANLLRRLIDASANGGLVATVAVFAVLPGFVEQCALSYPALGQRLRVVNTTDNGVLASSAAWRSPVLSLGAIDSTAGAERFLHVLIERMSSLVEETGSSLNGHQAELRSAGHDIISKNAGAGYRRDLVKQVASLALQYV